mmetsp:Transcript_12075/g.13491  ORF Transcript_12075/g.13491 Transcript_12075/m.13491 type:complete len:465 (-) Transcript_12075:2282-3676(-)
MWNYDEDLNGNEELVVLYMPVQAPPRKTNTSPLDSHIGGQSCFEESFTSNCDVCNCQMILLAQLRFQHEKSTADTFDRYLLVFICPREECFGQLVFDKGFSSGQGVVKCFEKRIYIDSSEDGNEQKEKKLTTKSSWYTTSNFSGRNDDDNNNDDDDWGMEDCDNEQVNLENAVAAMESNLDQDGALMANTKEGITPKPNDYTSNYTSKSSSEALMNSFGCYLLKMQNEPKSVRPMFEDDDDVGLSESDDKIRNMLARYMAEEEDEDILAALRGSNSCDSGGGGGNDATEEDERLSEEDRILRSFQDRQRRAPRQVIRYASKGKPLWSIPDKNCKSGKMLWNVPNCSCCGEQREFEFQLLPSILAALEVDMWQTGVKATAGTGESLALDELLSNGVNFGSIAVFTCSNASCRIQEKEAFAVIQKSVDVLPDKKERTSNIAVNDFHTASMAVVEDLDDDAEFEPIN